MWLGVEGGVLDGRVWLACLIELALGAKQVHMLLARWGGRCQPTKLTKNRPGVSVRDMTDFELCNSLLQAGWSRICRDARSSREHDPQVPYKEGGGKIGFVSQRDA